MEAPRNTFLAANPANEFPGQSDPGPAAFRDEEAEEGVSYQYLGLGAKHLSHLGACMGMVRDRPKMGFAPTPEIDARTAQELAPVRMCNLCLMRLGVSTLLGASCFDVSNSVISSHRLPCNTYVP